METVSGSWEALPVQPMEAQKIIGAKSDRPPNRQAVHRVGVVGDIVSNLMLWTPVSHWAKHERVISA